MSAPGDCIFHDIGLIRPRFHRTDGVEGYLRSNSTPEMLALTAITEGCLMGKSSDHMTQTGNGQCQATSI